MSENASQYFSNLSKQEEQIDFSNELLETSQKLNQLKIDNPITSTSSEPSVCRLFSENTLQTNDSTAAFFDLISNPNNTNAMMQDFDLSTLNSDGYNSRVDTGSEASRRRDAWIPSERTRQCLIACATNPPGTFFPDRDMLTMPGVLLEEDLGDNLGESVSMCLGEAEAAQRNILSADDVTQDERGLKELIQAGSYRAAVNLTSRLLTIYGQGRGRFGHPSKHSAHSLQIWFTRIALLIKSKAFNFAQAEAEPFGQLDKPDLYYQFYPDMYGSRPGSIASFSFRLLLAELPLHCGNAKESLTKLFSVLSTVRQILDNLKEGLCEDGNPMEISKSDRTDSERLWTGRETRVLHSIVNCALALKDFELAIEVMEELCGRDGAPKDSLLSALGRLHLQLGDVTGAEACFNEVRSLLGASAPSLRDLVDKGLLGVAQNMFEEALVSFRQANMMDPNNIMILNNMGVCLLYSGQLKEAIAVLESAISNNPVQALHESLLINLCTLYDMESSKGRMKKFALLKQLSKYKSDAPALILEKLYG